MAIDRVARAAFHKGGVIYEILVDGVWRKIAQVTNMPIPDYGASATADVTASDNAAGVTISGKAASGELSLEVNRIIADPIHRLLQNAQTSGNTIYNFRMTVPSDIVFTPVEADSSQPPSVSIAADKSVTFNNATKPEFGSNPLIQQGLSIRTGTMPNYKYWTIDQINESDTGFKVVEEVDPVVADASYVIMHRGSQTTWIGDITQVTNDAADATHRMMTIDMVISEIAESVV